MLALEEITWKDLGDTIDVAKWIGNRNMDMDTNLSEIFQKLLTKQEWNRVKGRKISVETRDY